MGTGNFLWGEQTMDPSQRRERGLRLLEQMLGPEQADQTRQRWLQICPDFEAYVIEFLAGEIWSRPGLDLRTKSLVTVAALATAGRPLGLELNIRMALRNGASRQEIVETLLHIAPYAGFPACWEGLALAHKIFAEGER
jgi:4-carboxymuconolactone decarboxylase